MSAAVPVGRPVRRRTRWPLAVLFGVVGALVVGVVVLAFVWPSATADPRGLRVGIEGPADQVAALKKAAAAQTTDPFSFVTVDSRADAVTRIRDRDLYGAVLLGDSPEVLTSSAASAASNQALRGIASALQARISASVEQALVGRLKQAGTAIGGLQQEVGGLQKEIAALQQALRTGVLPPSGTDGTGGSAPSGSSGGSSSAPATIPTVQITDVVPLSSHDTTGAGLTAASFPLVLGGMLGGVLVSLLVVGPARRVVALLVYGAAAGAMVTLVLQTWLQVLQRDWLTNAAAFSLSMTATAALVVGCNSLLGTRGIAIGAVISVLVGNPISGAAVPYQFIVGPWGSIGQYFVPGAASTLVRSLSYFPDADTGRQWLTLGIWAAGGLVLTVVGHFRGQEPVPLPAGELEPAARPRQSSFARNTDLGAEA